MSLPPREAASSRAREGHADAKRTGHPFHMWESISETPEAVRRCLNSDTVGTAISAGKALARRNIERIFLVGCGSSYHAALSTAYALSGLAGVDADACNAYEFSSHRLTNVSEKTGVITFSHSGSTDTTVEAARLARERGAFTVCLTHAPDSPLAKHADMAIPIEGGIEPVYPKTRSYIETVVMGYLLAAGMAAAKLALDPHKPSAMLEAELQAEPQAELHAEANHKPSPKPNLKPTSNAMADFEEPRGKAVDEEALLQEVRRIPELLERCRPLEEQAKMLANKYAGFRRVLLVGGGANYVSAIEIALKFKEAVLIAGEGLEIEEAFHGPIVSLDSRTLVVTISVPGPSHERVSRFARVASAMGSSVLSVGPEPYEREGIDTMKVPMDGIREAFSGSVLVQPLYMLSYYSALVRGNNPDTFRLEEMGLDRLMKEG